jgi:hypothetical protein
VSPFFLQNINDNNVGTAGTDANDGDVRDGFPYDKPFHKWFPYNTAEQAEQERIVRWPAISYTLAPQRCNYSSDNCMGMGSDRVLVPNLV